MAGRRSALKKKLLSRANVHNLTFISDTKCENENIKEKSKMVRARRQKKQVAAVLKPANIISEREHNEQVVRNEKRKGSSSEGLVLDENSLEIKNDFSHVVHSPISKCPASTSIRSGVTNSTRKSASIAAGCLKKVIRRRRPSNESLSTQSECSVSSDGVAGKNIFDEFQRIECSCGQQAKIEDMQKRLESFTNTNQRLREKYKNALKRCMNLSDALSSKLLNPTNKSVFTEVPGFVGRDQLEKFSTAGYKSDYVFIKLLMLEVWPDGLSGRSVTGRMSNNPLGRGLHTSSASSQQDRFSIKTALEPEKVEYIAGRLYEHRLNMGDSPAVARINAEECNRLMSRVISYHGKQVTSGHH